MNGHGWAPGTLTDIDTYIFKIFTCNKVLFLKKKKNFFSSIYLFLAHKPCKNTWQARVSPWLRFDELCSAAPTP